MNSSILLFPDEILERIIGSLNKQDTINLSLVHSRFTKLCQVKLLKNIYIYNDDKFFKFTKKAIYIDECLKYTVVGLRKFTQLLASSSNSTSSSHFKEIIVANDDIAYLDYYEFMQRKKFPVKYDRINEVEVNKWFRNQEFSQDNQTLMELADLKRKSQLLASVNHQQRKQTDYADHFVALIIIILAVIGTMYYFGYFDGSLLNILFGV